MATTNPEPIPGFDAVKESRKWREVTSRLLDAMGRDKRLAYLEEARKRYLAGCAGAGLVVRKPVPESCVVREDPPMP